MGLSRADLIEWDQVNRLLNAQNCKTMGILFAEIDIFLAERSTVRGDHNAATHYRKLAIEDAQTDQLAKALNN